MAEQDRDTVENVSPALAAAKYFVAHTEELAYEFGAASHAGLRRRDNQDHYIILRRTRTQQLQKWMPEALALYEASGKVPNAPLAVAAR